MAPRASEDERSCNLASKECDLQFHPIPLLHPIAFLEVSPILQAGHVEYMPFRKRGDYSDKVRRFRRANRLLESIPTGGIPTGT